MRPVSEEGSSEGWLSSVQTPMQERPLPQVFQFSKNQIDYTYRNLRVHDQLVI